MKVEVDNSILNIRGGLFGEINWNTNLAEAPFETPVLTTEIFKSGEKKGKRTIKINSRVSNGDKGDNCWWSDETRPIAWSPIPIYDGAVH